MKKFKLRTLNVRKTYGTVVALEAASIKMNEGEFLTLLGPSGSGKTTLAKLGIANCLKDDDGKSGEAEQSAEGSFAIHSSPQLS